MAVIDLKLGNVEQALERVVLSTEQKEKIRQEREYYDEYYLTSSGKTVTVFQQEFVNDPHMNLSSFSEVRLVNYELGVETEDLGEIFERDTVPIITRVPHGLLLPGFHHIESKSGGKSALISVEVPIPANAISLVSPEIRVMESVDLSGIEQIFKKEYSLRYRLVPLMAKGTPEACFVYEQEGTVGGVTFNAIEGNKLRMRQIFVKEGYRGGGIGQALYTQRLAFARQRGLTIAIAHIRNESRAFHEKFGALTTELPEYYVIRK